MCRVYPQWHKATGLVLITDYFSKETDPTPPTTRLYCRAPNQDRATLYMSSFWPIFYLENGPTHHDFLTSPYTTRLLSLIVNRQVSECQMLSAVHVLNSGILAPLGLREKTAGYS